MLARETGLQAAVHFSMCSWSAAIHCVLVASCTPYEWVATSSQG